MSTNAYRPDGTDGVLRSSQARGGVRARGNDVARRIPMLCLCGVAPDVWSILVSLGWGS